MKKILLGLALLAAASSASANVTYYECSARDNMTDQHPRTGYMLSLGMWQGSGYYDLEGVMYRFNADEMASPDTKILGEDGSILTGRDWAGDLVSFAIHKQDHITIYACASADVNQAELKEAVNSMSYPDDKQ